MFNTFCTQPSTFIFNLQHNSLRTLALFRHTPFSTCSLNIHVPSNETHVCYLQCTVNLVNESLSSRRSVALMTLFSWRRCKYTDLVPRDLSTYMGDKNSRECFHVKVPCCSVYVQPLTMTDRWVSFDAMVPRGSRWSNRQTAKNEECAVMERRFQKGQR